MRIALIYPAARIDKKVLPDILPIGILYLAAVAEKTYGARVDVFDVRHGRGFPAKNQLDDYDLIGFSALTMQISHALRLAEKARNWGYKGPVIFGGPHASVAPQHLKDQPAVNAVFTGESEQSFLEYLKYLEGKPHDLQRVWTLEKNGDWKYYPAKSFIENLDELPFPAREKYGDVPSRLRHINLTTTRGCPFDCSFCQPSKRLLFGGKTRRRSAGNIVEELLDARNRFNITRFSIDDDTFTFHKKSALEFCEKVKPLNLTWSCQSRTDVDHETLKAMRDAGCYLTIVGAESGSQRILDAMNKKTTVEQNVLFIRRCNELGIDSFCNMIVGYPGETEEDMKLSLEFIKKTQPTRTNVSQLTPFPGTHIWESHKEDIISAKWDHIARHVHRPKFRSLASKQSIIKNYITLTHKPQNHPIGAELVRLSPFSWRLYCKIPYLLRVVVHSRQGLFSLLEQALTLARSGKMGKALLLLRFLTWFKTSRPNAMGHLGWIYLEGGAYRKAIKAYRKILKSSPENWEAHYLLAKALYSTGDVEAAKAEIHRCLSLNPGFAPAREFLTIGGQHNWGSIPIKL